MRITVVCQYFPPESNAPAVRTHEHAREWARLGHEVTVITGFPNHPDGVIHPGYRGEWLRRERVDGVEVIRTWLYAAANRGFFKRVLSFLSFFLSSVVLGRIHGPRPDVVVGTSPQFFTAVSAYLLSRMYGVPFVFELRDIWPESAVELGALRSRLVLRPLLALQRHLYRSAARIVIVSEGFRAHLHEAGIPDARIAYVPNGIDPAFLEQPGDDPAALRERLGLADRFVVSYLGTHGMAHALGTLLDAADALRDEADLHFLFAGDGAERERLERRAAELALPNVTFLGQQPRMAMVGLYRASDLCIVPLRDLPMFRKVLPSKIFEILGFGIPIVCSVPGEAGELVRRSGGGVVIPPEDAEALARAIRSLRADPERLKTMGCTGRAFVVREHLRPALAARMADVLAAAVRAAPDGRLAAAPERRTAAS
ncbi:MAG TPA: glycosyltransferase family 4 protein [Longimicrobiales bacterium]